MKKKIIILLSVVIILLMGIVVWFNIPLDLMDLDPNEVMEIVVFNGNCNLRRASATDALTSGRLAEQNGRPPDNPNSVLQLDHHDIMLGDPLEDCVSRYCIVHDHGLPFVWFPLGTDDRAP